MNLIPRYASSLINAIRHRNINKLTARFRKQQWWTTEDLYKERDERTRSLISHSTRHVEYYKNIFQQLDFDEGDLYENFHRIPILTKNLLRLNYEELISMINIKRGRVNYSGGSTGKPVKFLSDLYVYDIMAANLNLIFSWAGWRPGEMRFEFWGGQKKNKKVRLLDYTRIILSGHLMIPVFTYNDDDMYNWWMLYNKFQPTIIYGYPSIISDFAHWLNNNNFKPFGVKGVFTTAETLLFEHRENIENTIQS